MTRGRLSLSSDTNVQDDAQGKKHLRVLATEVARLRKEVGIRAKGDVFSPLADCGAGGEEAGVGAEVGTRGNVAPSGAGGGEA